MSWTVEITIPQAGLNVDADVYLAAGGHSSFSGTCLMTGDRDHGWENLTKAEAVVLMERLHAMAKDLNELNGRDLGIRIAAHQAD